MNTDLVQRAVTKILKAATLPSFSTGDTVSVFGEGERGRKRENPAV